MSAASHYSSGGASVSAAGASAIGDRLQRTQAEHTENARKAFLKAFGVAARDVDADLQARGKSIHSNAQALTKQEKELQEQTKRLAKENQATEKWLEKSHKKIAEFDDLLNFDIEEDGLEDTLGDLEAMLDIMEKEEKSTNNDRNPSTEESVSTRP